MDKYAGFDFEQLKKAGEEKKSFTFGNFKQAQVENWKGPGPGFDNAPGVPNAGNPDKLEMNEAEEIKVGDWVRIDPNSDFPKAGQTGQVIDVTKRWSGPSYTVEFPRGGGIPSAAFSRRALTKVSQPNWPDDMPKSMESRESGGMVEPFRR